ncbi:MAG: oxygen-independent coproporphyrinogen III oxidase [Lachnospiraceae bacterium]|nr:oxygen-independent coproporphyrinogen III oxidase [Lachnospiraceae bacterium]
MKTAKKELEIYIHIPFCVRKCNYCDFLSVPADDATKEAYMEALCREIVEKGKEYVAYEVSTIFIGGGTPTAVPAGGIKGVVEAVRLNYDLRDDIEITMEMNPGTVDATALKVYKEAGINRLSIGLQSTESGELQSLGRIHSYEQFLDTYRLAREAGFLNINVDIMSALPGQTFESYERTLQRVVQLVPPPEHISAYSLIIEEGTPFYEAYESDSLQLPDEDTERKMYEFTGSFLEQYGYERYEISNYAKPGKECRHNLGYWERKNYVGFGIGAASLVENVRFHNNKDMQKYIKNPYHMEENRQTLSVTEQMEETMFLGLRKTKGVALQSFEKVFGMPMLQVYGEVINKHVAEGLLEFWEDTKGRKYLALTPKGMDVSNYVMADFLEPSIF